mgnify:CR=1 FL=1
MDYIKKLEYEADPDYAYLKNIFKNISIREKFEYDFQFDWIVGKCNLDAIPRNDLKKTHSNVAGMNSALHSFKQK